MNEKDLVDAVAASVDDSKTVTGETIIAVLGVVTRSVTAGDVVQLDGFESVSMGQYPVRIGRNPSMGAEIQITAEKTLKVAVGKVFTDAVGGP
ncbi:HU family DNA-binding protein [Caballeronia sp. DA-9]|uniref:HU family DNA-binding protein n=1 Tax=Caballeronia sp. DA-9 TaxID=3436237 RepID=UPI003F67F120